MIPREHGAYAQLLVPLATALAIGRPTAAALSLAGGAVLVFLGHETLITMAGGRPLLSAVARVKHTLTGELAAAVILAAISWPVARAAGTSVFAATACAVAFAASFAVGVVAVHGVMAAARTPPAAAARAAAFLVALGVWGALTMSARAGVVSVAAAWAVFPTCVAGSVLAAWPPSMRRLRVVGWTLVAVTTLAAVVLIAVLG